MSEPAQLPAVSRRHLDVLSDGVAIMQHAIGSEPDPAHGYCTDDVARALQVDLLHARTVGWDQVADRAWRNVRFLEAAFEPDTGRFRNFRGVDGAWLPGTPSEDSQGRAMLALGETIAGSTDPAMIDVAAELFTQALPTAQGVSALRAQASVLLGCDAAMTGRPASRTAMAYRSLATRIATSFEGRAGGTWPWPESRLTYENALPVRAMIVAGDFVGSRPMTDLGLGLLDWLLDVQTAPGGHLSPIGNGWWPCGGERSTFDQQPIEATALLLAAEDAARASGSQRYRAAMERAYGWFLGANDLGLAIADPVRGACGDGLTPTGINRNEGAESTLMWLMALEHLRSIRPVRAAPAPIHAVAIAPMPLPAVVVAAP